MPSPLTVAILSGGAGTRLWPLSRQGAPKQFHALIGEESLFADTVARLEGLSDAPPLVLCGQGHRKNVEAVLGPDAAMLIEPAAKNTAPAAAAACLHALSAGGDPLVLILPADHHIEDAEGFRTSVAKAAEIAADERIVTLGIEPLRPETGYGYIERGAPLGAGFEVKRFVEKPDAARAQSYLDAGGFYWNAGVYLVHARTFLAELETFAPDMLAAVSAAYKAARGERGAVLLDADAWAAAPSDSIDYAVAEKTDRAAVVAADIGWSDVGSWEAIHELADKTGEGNALRGEVFAVDAKGCLVRADGGRPVALVGCEDLIVIDTGDVVCIAPRARSQDIKRLIEEVGAGRKDLL